MRAGCRQYHVWTIRGFPGTHVGPQLRRLQIVRSHRRPKHSPDFLDANAGWNVSEGVAKSYP